MPAKHVIHTVGPVYGQGGEAKSQLLAACYANSLALAVENSLHSIAFPAISTGVYGYPLSEAAVVSSSTIEQYLKNETTIQEVRLVFFAGSDAEVFVRHQRFSR
jgi:O-acetyl-ADP-ribose deacetylase (regulator of RNase III)